MKAKYKLDEPGLNLLRAKYDGSTQSIDELVRRLQMPRSAIKRLAMNHGLTRHKEPPWTQEDVEYLEANLHKLRYRDIAQHLHRSETAIKLKAKRLGVRKSGESYTMRALMQGLGMSNHHKIQDWVKWGWLKASRRQSDRSEAQGGDMWLFTENAIRLFVRDHPQEIDPRRADWLWLVDILAGSPLHPVQAPRRQIRRHYLSGRRKLTADEVADIRTRYLLGEETMERLGLEHGVSTTSISKLINYRTWTHVE